MTDRKALVDPNETPEDVATLYSWANLHGAKYRDFSASRAQMREKARQRVQDAIESERRRSREEAEAQAGTEAVKPPETPRQPEPQRAAEPDRQAEYAAREMAQRAEQMAAEQAAHLAAQQRAAQQAAAAYQQPAPAAPMAAPAHATVPPAAPQTALGAPLPANSFYAQMPQQAQYPATYPPPQQPYAPPAGQPGFTPVREDNYLQTRSQWAAPEPREQALRPAWLSTTDRNDVPATLPQAPEDTLQGSRDRLTSRWYALKGVFAGAPAQAEVAPVPSPARAPMLAVFSLAGGVGKTSLVATLGRALSARGERVLLVDTTPFGLLPFFFGARDQRPGVLRTFTPPGTSGDAPIQLVTIDPETLGPENAPQEMLTQEISRNSREANRVLVDLATASGATTRRVLRMSPVVLVPVVPDMSSVVSVSSIDAFFHRNAAGSGQPVMPFYILNQFDPSLPLHLDVREVLREQLGDRLLPFALRRAPAVSEALAEGMTVMDYAPASTVAEDFGALAGWVKSLSAPASGSYRGIRWSER